MWFNTSGTYYKNIAIVNDASRVIRMTIVSGTSSRGVTYDRHSDNTRDLLYAPRSVNYASREHLWYRGLYYKHVMIANDDSSVVSK